MTRDLYSHLSRTFRREAQARKNKTTMSTWDDYTKNAQKSDESDFNDERPHVPDGVYHAVCIRVSEPYDKLNQQNGEMQKKFVADFELSAGRLREPVTIPSFMTLPPKYLSEGYLHPKAWVYKVMEAFGYDMTSRFRVDPPAWAADQLQCDVFVKNNDAGQSWIQDFLTCSCETAEEPAPAPPPTPKPQPIGAGAGRAPARDLRKELEG